MSKLLPMTILLIVSMIMSQGTMAWDGPEQKPTVGLALSGGAALGLAHIGVLQVLEENDIGVDIVVGTSMGAIIGALYAAGMSSQAIAEATAELQWSDLTTGPSLFGLGLFTTEGIQEFVAAQLPEDNFSGLPKRLAVVTTGLDSGRMIILDEGSVSKAVGASAAIPVIFAPVDHTGELLVDGGLTKNLPDTVARDLGADIVIAVPVNSTFRYEEPPEGKIDVGIRAYNIAMMFHSQPSDADIVIAPELTGMYGIDLDAHDEFVRRGREAAEAVIPELLALLEP